MGDIFGDRGVGVIMFGNKWFIIYLGEKVVFEIFLWFKYVYL